MNKNKSRLVIGVTLLTLLLVFFLNGSSGDRVVEVRLNRPVDVKSGAEVKPEGAMLEVTAKGSDPLTGGSQTLSPATQTKGSVSESPDKNFSEGRKNPKDKETSPVSHDIQIKKKVLNSMLQSGKGTKFKVVLFEGEEIEVNITRRDPLLEKGAILYGAVDGEPGSSAHFSIYEGAMFAEIMFGTRRYKID